MYNLYAIFAKILNICKQVAGNLDDESGNLPRKAEAPRYSELEIAALYIKSLPRNAIRKRPKSII